MPKRRESFANRIHRITFRRYRVILHVSPRLLRKMQRRRMTAVEAADRIIAHSNT